MAVRSFGDDNGPVRMVGIDHAIGLDSAVYRIDEDGWYSEKAS